MRDKVNRVWDDPKKVWGAKVKVDPELEYADESAAVEATSNPARLEDDIYESESVATFNWSRDQDYLVKYLVNRGQVGAITAPPESGKSPVLMDLCAHVALGKPFNGLRVREPSFCYYYATEGKSDIGNRFKGARTAHGFENDPDCPFEFRCGGLILGAADPQKSQKSTDKLIRTVKKRSAHYGRKPGLIIVDTGSQAIVGTDSDDAVVRNLIQNCKRIASETGATVIIAAHPPKSGDSLIRGSGAYVADAEFVWSIEVDAKTGRRELVNARSKAFVKGKRFRFNIPVIDLGADSEGDHVTAPGIEWVDTPEVEMEVLPEKNEELALRVLNDLVDEKIAAGKIGAFRFKEGHEAFTNAKNAKNTDPEIGAKSCTNTRSAFNSALTRLVQLGAFEKVGENKQSQYVRPR
jgi:hypothetical protein